jgi:hypothetical protein
MNGDESKVWAWWALQLHWEVFLGALEDLPHEMNFHAIMLHMGDMVPSDDEEDDPRTSLNAITDISSAEMMQLHIWLANATLEVLIDSGSTHSFMFMRNSAAWSTS